mmetsp:Transcript_6315/g.11331  ORF Transcript_6315/g.11331 Transcript_6315/m.11331 type:complete len:323 (-) Transcript_6315:300-1268(-)
MSFSMVSRAFSARDVAASTTFFTCVPTSPLSLCVTSFSSSTRNSAVNESIIPVSSSNNELPLRTNTRSCSKTGPLVRLIRMSSSTKGVSKVPTLMNSPKALLTPKMSPPSGSKYWDVPATFNTELVQAIFVLKTGATLSTSALCTNITLDFFTCNGFTFTVPSNLNNGDSSGMISSSVSNGVNSTTLSTRLIPPPDSEVPSLRIRCVTVIALRMLFWMGLRDWPSLPKRERPDRLFFFLLAIRLLLLKRRRMSDDGKFAVAINVQSPSNMSFSRSLGVEDANASRSLMAFWSLTLSEGRLMNFPEGELDANVVERARRRLRA